MIAAVAGREACGYSGSVVRRIQALVFNRKQVVDEQSRSDAQSALVERLLDADERERRRLLLVALQTGELKKSEVADLLRLVERLESVSRNG
jgi:hypothetical protein